MALRNLPLAHHPFLDRTGIDFRCLLDHTRQAVLDRSGSR